MQVEAEPVSNRKGTPRVPGTKTSPCAKMAGALAHNPIRSLRKRTEFFASHTHDAPTWGRSKSVTLSILHPENRFARKGCSPPNGGHGNEILANYIKMVFPVVAGLDQIIKPRIRVEISTCPNPLIVFPWHSDCKPFFFFVKNQPSRVGSAPRGPFRGRRFRRKGGEVKCSPTGRCNSIFNEFSRSQDAPGREKLYRQ